MLAYLSSVRLTPLPAKASFLAARNGMTSPRTPCNQPEQRIDSVPACLVVQEEASEQPGCEVLAGMVTVHMVELREGPGSMPKALSLPEGTPLALVANMAVRRQSRRQGLAKSMLCAAEALVQQQFYPAPTALALLVHKGNHPAVSLYNTLGYQEAPG